MQKDAADLVDQAIAGVRDAILIGIALSLLVIALSLRDWRAGLVAAVPVPLTVVTLVVTPGLTALLVRKT